MKPDFQVLADEHDITALIRDRLIEIRITDKPGLDSDSCEIELDDRDGKLRFPRKGAVLAVSLGWVGEGMNRLGRYRVDEIEVKGPPAAILIRCKAADVSEDSKTHRRGSWEDTTLSTIVGDIAGRHGWQPVCAVQAEIVRADQVGESDLHFLTRLARLHNATATVKAGKLLVLPRDSGQQASGGSMAELAISPAQCHSYSMVFPDRPAHAKVRTQWHDPKVGQPVPLILPNPSAPPGATAVHIDRHTYANPQAARDAADSRLGALNRATANGHLVLARGDARLCAERKVRLKGFKPQVDGVFLAESVEHAFSHSGWITTVQLNAGNAGKAQVGRTSQADLPIPAPLP
ncbi:late control protein [Chitinimonas arctica]|uniref:Late control protein n=1 Tax=Chitinimonas arctica TaxID=2594795 RepID=A0A516S9T5_9NEIS|nr:contractile injection system protein, VgrG/Pvc8 family [Chitinimonas arctica]QDQ24913.1 late control protein [Chitinimonas arctica]